MNPETMESIFAAAIKRAEAALAEAQAAHAAIVRGLKPQNERELTRHGRE